MDARALYLCPAGGLSPPSPDLGAANQTGAGRAAPLGAASQLPPGQDRCPSTRVKTPPGNPAGGLT